MKYTLQLGLGDKSDAIVVCILSVKLVLYSVVNLHHLLSERAAFTTQSCSSLTSYAKKIADDIIDIMKSRCDNKSCLPSFSDNYGSV